ncbi:phage tail tape measure protein [Enterobacter kobei]|uniref:phage tail tape measure protein n=1 Tax=Enterobacter cloacae complex TaxID=354276 RepID=UPI001257DA3B|nr:MULTISPECIES: phage tail tape measure protein [Enterobacter cloacae complex]MCM7357667.1 phage tail tape measure protein [Enterobacter hormaechei]HBK4724999.1 phage tail tape measure protein [Enterobacter hormaechei subsp. steigerwaltii]MCW4941852.1 phage tail tape measure protein [Enterobacter hormaechei subsp. xiangfangensis]VAX71217.1 phage tail tape measure protein [Enterobacter kobei]HBK4820304.1 phage tail tape measure protein [Enterobacter hormaechei subsp. steigerwaltii]
MSDNVKLQVLLKAVDQATRPFKAVQAASKTLAGDIRGSQDELKALNAQSRRIEGFRAISGQLAVTGTALKKAKDDTAALALQMRNTANPTAAQVRAFENARRSAAALQEKYNSLRQSVHRQRTELQQSGIDTRNLADAGRTLRASISETTASIDRQRAALARVSKQQERLNAVSQRYERGKAAAASVRNVSAAALGAGTAAVYAGSRLIAPEIQTQKNGALIAARQGEDNTKSTQYTEVIQRISASGVSDDLEKITEAVSAVRSTLGTLGNVGEAELDRISRKALDMQTAFGTDTTESIQIAAIMMKNGLAASSDEAMDLIVSGMQRVSAEMRGEMPEILHEYSTHFRNLGFSGAEAMSLLVDMSKQGKFALDKTGDAIKEFSIRGSDMSKNSVAAYEEIGLNAKKMSSDIASGGEKARMAMQKTAKGLLAIKDPAQRANAAISLFGTPIEDLSIDQIPAFLGALAGVKNQFGDVSGAADNMGKTLRDNLSGDVARLSGQFEGLRFSVFTQMDAQLRTLTQTATNWLGKLNAWVNANPALASNLVMITGAIAGVAVVLGGLGLVVWPVMTGINALIAGAGFLSVGFSMAGSAIVAAISAISWPIVAVVAAVVAGALLIRKYWEPISAFFGGVVEGLKAAFAPVAELFAPLKPVFDWLGVKLQELWQWFSNLIAPVKSTQDTLNSCRDAGVLFGQALAEALTLPLTAFNKLRSGIDWVLEKLGVINKESGTLDKTAAKANAAAQSGGYVPAPSTYGGYQPYPAPAGNAPGWQAYQPAAGQSASVTGGYQSYKPVTAPAGRSYVDQSKNDYHITVQGGAGSGTNLDRQLQDALEKYERDKRARNRSSMMHDE